MQNPWIQLECRCVSWRVPDWLCVISRGLVVNTWQEGNLVRWGSSPCGGMPSWLPVLLWRLGGSLSSSGKATRAFDILSKMSWLERPASFAWQDRKYDGDEQQQNRVYICMYVLQEPGSESLLSSKRGLSRGLLGPGLLIIPWSPDVVYRCFHLRMSFLF